VNAFPAGTSVLPRTGLPRTADTVRGHPQLNDLPRYRKILHLETKTAKPEIVEGAEKASGVVFGGIDPEVNVLGEPGPSVKGHRMSSHEEVLNPSLKLDELDEVFAQAQFAT
jgi:hypothetical protein